MVMDPKGVAEFMREWQKTAMEAAQDWAKLYAQRPEADPLESYRQMSTDWVKAFSGALKQAAPGDTELLRKFLAESMEAWTKTIAEVMGGEEYSKAMGMLLSQHIASQGALRRDMLPYFEELWKTLDLASRKQVLGVSEQLLTIEKRVEGLEDRLGEMKQQSKQPASANPASPAAARPAVPAPASRRPRRPKA